MMKQPDFFQLSMKRGGFSLIEVVLALGIISFALVGIMGLFPVAMHSSQDSQRQTRATFIAQQVFNDLRSRSGANTILTRGPSFTNQINWITGINLANSGTMVVLHDNDGIGLTDIVVPANYSASIPVANAVYATQVVVTPNVGGPSRVEATVQVPAVAASSNRASYKFVTLMGTN